MKAHPVWRRLFLLRVKENWQSLHRKTLSCCPVWRIFNFNTFFLLAMSCFAFWLGNCTLSNFWECFFVLQSENFQNLLMCVKCNLLHIDFQVMVKNLDVILTCNKSKSLGWLKVFGPTKSSSSMSSKVAYKKRTWKLMQKIIIITAFQSCIFVFFVDWTFFPLLVLQIFFFTKLKSLKLCQQIMRLFWVATEVEGSCSCLQAKDICFHS